MDLSACIDYWAELEAGVFSGLRELFADLRADFANVADPKTKALVATMLEDFEVQARCWIPSAVSLMLHHHGGSEKLVDFVDEIASDNAKIFACARVGDFDDAIA